MGQIVVPGTPPAIILTAVDRLVASNADGGLSPLATHVILLGEDAGENLGALSNVIALGFNALSGGLTDIAHGSGAIAIGGNAAAAAVAMDGNGTTLMVGTSLAIGLNAASSLVDFPSSVVIGGNAAPSIVSTAAGQTFYANVLIGSEVAQFIGENGGGTGVVESVIIGRRAARGLGAFSQKSMIGVVIIGAGAAESAGLSGATNSVIIGRNAVPNANGIQNNVVIGDQAGLALSSGDGNTLIGDQTNSGATSTDATVVGRGSGSANVGSHSTLLGAGIPGSSGDRNVWLGRSCGVGETASVSKFMVETLVGTTQTLLYGDIAIGSLAVGTSTPGTSRAFPGTNLLKLINGTVTGVAPVGGGFFYSVGGELHWVSTGNVDYALTPAASRGVFTVATLPAVGLVAGQTAYVNDAAAPAFGAAPVGGGAVFVPVFYNGAAWIVG